MNIKAENERRKQFAYAMKLQQFLGDEYDVHYDQCESGYTSVYYKNRLVKRVLNDQMNGELNVYDFKANEKFLYDNNLL